LSPIQQHIEWVTRNTDLPSGSSHPPSKEVDPMSAQIQTIPRRSGHPVQWTRWAVAAAVVAVLAAAGGTYLALRTDSITPTQKPGVTTTAVPHSGIAPVDLGNTKPLEPVRKPVGRYVGEYPEFGATFGAGVGATTVSVGDSSGAGQTATSSELPCRGLIRQPC
jgi:hypothetical protein